MHKNKARKIYFLLYYFDYVCNNVVNVGHYQGAVSQGAVTARSKSSELTNRCDVPN